MIHNMVSISRETLLRRERELMGALSEVQGMISHLNNEELKEATKIDQEKRKDIPVSK